LWEHPLPGPHDPAHEPKPAQRLEQAYAAWWASTGLAADTPAIFHRRPGED
jgi:hypothetical protein